MLRLSSLLLIIATISACSSSPLYHKVLMRGQVVGFDEDQVVFCIGSDAGGMVGQEFVVFRYTYEDYVEGEEFYGVVQVGTVVVRQIVNEHFAKGEISSGEVSQNDMLFAK